MHSQTPVGPPPAYILSLFQRSIGSSSISFPKIMRLDLSRSLYACISYNAFPTIRHHTGSRSFPRFRGHCTRCKTYSSKPSVHASARSIIVAKSAIVLLFSSSKSLITYLSFQCLYPSKGFQIHI